MLSQKTRKQGLRRILYHQKVDPIVEQVKKVMGATDQRLILMVRG